MPYITNSNHHQFTDTFLGLKRIYVRRLSGEIHFYNKVNKLPSIHSNFNCQRLLKDFEKSGYSKLNTGAAFVINYPVEQLSDNSFIEVDDTVSEFQNSLYFHAGFNKCQFCAFVNSLEETTPNDYLSAEEWGNQYSEDVESLKRYFKENPNELDSWLGLD